MRDSVTVHMAASPEAVWELVSDVRNTGKFSPETLEAEWLDGASRPAVGAKFRGHVKRNGRGPMYWTVCEVTACERGKSFGFNVLTGGKPINTWLYEFAAAGGGVDVTESFALVDRPATAIYKLLFGKIRTRTNHRNMLATLERIKAVAEKG